MTELERARAHLRCCQSDLRFHRKTLSMLTEEGHRKIIDKCECALFAALAWVWEEQEKRLVFVEQVAWLIGCPLGRIHE